MRSPIDETDLEMLKLCLGLSKCFTFGLKQVREIQTNITSQQQQEGVEKFKYFNIKDEQSKVLEKTEKSTTVSKLTHVMCLRFHSSLQQTKMQQQQQITLRGLIFAYSQLVW